MYRLYRELRLLYNGSEFRIFRFPKLRDDGTHIIAMACLLHTFVGHFVHFYGHKLCRYVYVSAVCCIITFRRREEFHDNYCECHVSSAPAIFNIIVIYSYNDRLFGLVVRVSGYKYRGLVFDSQRYQIF